MAARKNRNRNPFSCQDNGLGDRWLVCHHDLSVADLALLFVKGQPCDDPDASAKCDAIFHPHD
jgi:hypothetical protein